MFKIKTIFAKQFILYIGALIISFAILAASLWAAVGNYFVAQKTKILTEQSRRVSDAFKTDIFGELYYDSQKINYEILVLHDYLDSSFIFVDIESKIYLATSDISVARGSKLNTKEFDKVFEGETTTSQGNVGGIFKEKVLTVAQPVYVNGTIIGAVLLSSSMPELQKSAQEMFRISLVCLLISSAFAFVLIFVFSRSISKPLRQMNEAAKIIASGDFEKRIEISSVDEVGQLAESFNFMADSLSEQDKLRRIFIGNISHDLRSPLTSIRGFLQAILDGTISAEKQEHYLKIVMDETERLSKLTHDIIDLNNIQTADVELDKTVFDINELIRKTVMLFENVALSKKLAVSINLASEHTFVLADSEKVQRVIYNLIDNAIKFSHESGVIVIETTENQKKVLISVKDNGIGIKPEEEKYIFDRFYKADVSRGQDKSGSGLGLSIVWAFVKAHGENITVKTEEGKGSEFVFTLPIAAIKNV